MKVKSVSDRDDEPLRIGELAARTGASTRALRYYEEQKLLAPEREANRYRAFASSDVTRIQTIQQLLSAGLSTAAIREVLPCLDPSFSPCEELRTRLRAEIDAVDRQLADLAESRRLLLELAGG